MTTLRIATRKSPLALWQSEYVAARLRAAHPGLVVELVPMSTRGDEVLDRSLAAIGGKGLFLKELELAMQRGDADCAVHSLKDVPMELEPGFALPAILARADHADAFVSNRFDTLDALAARGARRHFVVAPAGAVARAPPGPRAASTCAATSTRGWPNSTPATTTRSCWPARACSAWAWTRASARASMRRDWLPAPAQGAIAIECRDDDARTRALCAVLDDAADAHLRRSRARDEPRAARQLPRAGGGVRATATAIDAGICRAWWVRSAMAGCCVRSRRAQAADDRGARGSDVARRVCWRRAPRADRRAAARPIADRTFPEGGVAPARAQ